MRLPIAALLAGLLLVPAGAAFAQVATGNEITVNPVSGGGGVLLYPGGQYMRVVRPALEPGETLKDTGPIRLHMPGKSVTHRPTVAAAPRRARVAAAEPPPTPSPAPLPVTPLPARPARPVRTAPPPPAASGTFGGAPGASDFGGLEIAHPAGAPAQPAAPARQQLARAEPPPAITAAPPSFPGLTKHTMILFAKGASDPAEGAMGAIKFLAGDLNTAMTGPNARVELMAYGGIKGDKGSDSRRLSLKRALAIRQVLIDDGVSTDRIDVHAMGGVDDSGPEDRVDVYVKS